jgi:hypothetical protein
MTDAHAKAVEAAGRAVVRRLRRFEVPTVIAEAAITAYLAAMRADGWVMVPSTATVDMVTAAMSRPDYGASTTLFYGEIYRAMTEGAMLKGVGDGQG